MLPLLPKYAEQPSQEAQLALETRHAETTIAAF
jgi:hypothetical protein